MKLHNIFAGLEAIIATSHLAEIVQVAVLTGLALVAAYELYTFFEIIYEKYLNKEDE